MEGFEKKGKPGAGGGSGGGGDGKPVEADPRDMPEDVAPNGDWLLDPM